MTFITFRRGRHVFAPVHPYSFVSRIAQKQSFNLVEGLGQGERKSPLNVGMNPNIGADTAIF